MSDTQDKALSNDNIDNWDAYPDDVGDVPEVDPFLLMDENDLLSVEEEDLDDDKPELQSDGGCGEWLSERLCCRSLRQIWWSTAQEQASNQGGV